MRKLLENFKLYPPMLKKLAGCFLILFIGMTFVWPMNTIYITQSLGQTVKTAGIILMLFQGCALIGNITGGFIYDRWGGRRSIIIGATLSAIIVSLIGIQQELYYYTILLMCLGFCNGLIFPSVQALVISLWPEGGRKATNIVYIAQNLGIAIGAVLGGLIADVSVRMVFYSNAITYIIFLILFIRYIFDNSRILGIQQGNSRNTVFITAKLPLRFWVSLYLIGLGLMLCWVVYSQWASMIPLHTQNLSISLTQYSLLWTINGSFILLGQPISNWFIKRVTPHIKLQTIVGCLFFSAAMMVIAFSTSYWGFVLAMVIMTFGEMLAWPAIPIMVSQMTPESLKGRIFGITTGMTTVGRMMGPFIGGMMFDQISPKLMFLVFSSFTIIAFISFFFHDWVTKKGEAGMESRGISR